MCHFSLSSGKFCEAGPIAFFIHEGTTLREINKLPWRGVADSRWSLDLNTDLMAPNFRLFSHWGSGEMTLPCSQWTHPLNEGGKQSEMMCCCCAESLYWKRSSQPEAQKAPPTQMWFPRGYVNWGGQVFIDCFVLKAKIHLKSHWAGSLAPYLIDLFTYLSESGLLRL